MFISDILQYIRTQRTVFCKPVFRSSKFLFRIRIREGQVDMDPDPDPTRTFLWPINKFFFIEPLNIITFLRTLMNIKGLDPDLGGHLISDPPDPDPQHF
jgi:hypothetical protein